MVMIVLMGIVFVVALAFGHIGWTLLTFTLFVGAVCRSLHIGRYDCIAIDLNRIL